MGDKDDRRLTRSIVTDLPYQEEKENERGTLMNRRILLQSIASAVGVTLASSDLGAKTPRPSARRAQPLLIETSDGAALYWKEWGTGKPILFLHSWANSSDLWQYQMIHLSTAGFRCIAYDKRGHGRSNDPGQGYDYDTLADDLATVIKTLDLRQVTLVGHSMGCGEIVRYLSRHGKERVIRIVLVAPTLPFLLKTADNPDGIDKAIAERVRAAWSMDFPKWLTDNTPPFFVPETSRAMLDWGVRMSFQTSLRAAIDCSRAFVETDFRSELPSITLPTLIVQGDADVSAPLERTGRRTAKLIPGSELRVYEKAPHGLMLTHIDRFNADLFAFVDQ